MKRFYSKTTQTTYLSGIHAAMPDDAVEITNERYEEVIVNPVAGKIRSHDEHGLPILVDALPLTVEELSTRERLWRDAEIDGVKWLRERHRDQLDIGVQTTLTPEQFDELLVYMQDLRDWPAAPEFPAQEFRPTPPEWIATQAP